MAQTFNFTDASAAAAASSATLTAVNRILTLCGIQNVSGLDTGGASWAAVAERELDKSDLRIQRRGWHQNTERDVLLVPDGSDNITLASTVLVVDTVKSSNWINVHRRGTALWRYDSNTNAYLDTFTQDEVHVDIIYQRTFGNLSDSLRDHIATDAALNFYRQHARQLHRFDDRQQTKRELLAVLTQARLEALQEDSDNSDVNVLETAEANQLRGDRSRTFQSIL